MFKGLRLTAGRRPSNLGTMLALCWAYVGLCWAYVGQVEPSWELCWVHVWAIYVETILRCQFFRPGPCPGAQTHVKPRFCNIAKMKSLVAEGPETP